MKLKRIVLLVVVLVLVTTGVLYWRLTASPPAVLEDPSEPRPTPEVTKTGAEVGKVESPEERTRRMVLGVWQDEYKGKRTMTLKDDGTGTMVVELTGWEATLYASRLRFDMKWSLKGKQLTKTTTGGEPKEKVNIVLNLFGNTAEETIEELTENRLLVIDKDKKKFDWRRPKTDENGPK
jgi:hypothetical protein